MQKIVLWVGECFGVTASRTIDSSCYKIGDCWRYFPWNGCENHQWNHQARRKKRV